MAKKQAKNAGVSPKVVRQTVSNSSILVLLKIKFEEWQKARANRRWSKNMAEAKAALALGVSPKVKPAAPKPADSKPADPQKRKRLVESLLVALLLLALCAMVLTAVWYFTAPPEGNGSIVASLSATPTAVSAEAVLLAEPEAESESVYLRVETLQLDTAYGIWRRMAGIPILLSPFGEGGELRETLRQVTEEVLTTDGFLVAVTTFEVPEGTYWVAVDEATLPAGCAVWIPRLETDEEAGIAFGENPSWVAIRLDAYPGRNAAVVKFQIICGQEVPVSPTSVVPNSTPVPPTDVPPTNPPPTSPPPTEPPPPTPTDSCGPDCVEPSTPVPTPTEYPPDVPTPTPVR